jgi:hypothetical protein
MMEDLSLHILDISENAIEAGATRIAIIINENEKHNLLTIRVSDNGRGMSKETLRRALHPFFSTKGKRTGLGLSLLAQAAEQCSGGVSIVTAHRKGTRVVARFPYGHIDRPPLTNMKGTMTALVLGHTEIDFIYCHRRNGRVFRFASHGFFKGYGACSGLDPAFIGSVKKVLQAGLKRIGRT